MKTLFDIGRAMPPPPTMPTLFGSPKAKTPRHVIKYSLNKILCVMPFMMKHLCTTSRASFVRKIDPITGEITKEIGTKASV
jgi:hypothetical protein